MGTVYIQLSSKSCVARGSLVSLLVSRTVIKLWCTSPSSYQYFVYLQLRKLYPQFRLHLPGKRFFKDNFNKGKSKFVLVCVRKIRCF